MSDTVHSTAPAARPTLSAEDAAARLGDFGTAPATPRPPARNPASRQPVIAGRDGELDPGTRQDTGHDPTLRDDQTSDLAPADTDDGTDPEAPAHLPADTVLWTDDDGEPITLRDAQLSHLRRQDYTRKTEEISQYRGVLTQQMEYLHSDREAVCDIILRSLPELPGEDKLATMTGAEVHALQQQRAEMLAAVQQFRERTAQERNHVRQAELRRAENILPSLLPEWEDTKTADKHRTGVMEYLRAIGAPPDTAEKVGHDPWLLRALVDAITGRGVRRGARAGGQARAQQLQNGGQTAQGQGRIDPTLPPSGGAPRAVPQRGGRDAIREQARSGPTFRARRDAAVQLLGEAPAGRR